MKLEKALTVFLGQYTNENTVRAYYDILMPFIQNRGAGRRVEDMRPIDIHEYVNELQHNRGYAEATVYKHVKGIKRFFNWMEAIELITHNPTRTVRAKRPGRNIERDKAMTDEELQIVLSVVRWKARHYAMVLFLADTGCRAGGVANLKIEDLDLDHLRAIVTEKFNKTRPVWYGEETAMALRRWLLERPIWSHPYVFGSSGKMTASSVSQIVRRACLKGNIRSLGSHSLRIRKGYQFSDSGISPTVAATALGHSDPAITMAHYYPADYDRAERAIREHLTVPESNSITKKIIRLHRS